MRTVATSNDCNLPSAVFWALRLDLGFDHFLAQREKQTFELRELNETADGMVRRTASVTFLENPVPWMVRKALRSGDLTIRTSAEWHREKFDEAHGLRFSSAPSCSSKVVVDGRLYVEPVTTTQCRVHAVVTVRVDIAAIGTQVERLVEQQSRAAFAMLPAHAFEYWQQKQRSQAVLSHALSLSQVEPFKEGKREKLGDEPPVIGAAQRTDTAAMCLQPVLAMLKQLELTRCVSSCLPSRSRPSVSVPRDTHAAAAALVLQRARRGTLARRRHVVQRTRCASQHAVVLQRMPPRISDYFPSPPAGCGGGCEGGCTKAACSDDASAGAPRSLQGFLVKRGTHFPSWKRRFAAVDCDEMVLRYYARQPGPGKAAGAAAAAGQLRLSGARPTEAVAHGIIFEADAGRTMLAKLPSEVERSRWLAGLARLADSQQARAHAQPAAPQDAAAAA